jgi:hypothetical protein
MQIAEIDKSFFIILSGWYLPRSNTSRLGQAMHRQDLQGLEKVLGPDHPDKLTSISHLGSVLEDQGRYEEAEAMHRRALECREVGSTSRPSQHSHGHAQSADTWLSQVRFRMLWL